MLVVEHDVGLGSVLEIALGLEHGVDRVADLASAVRALRNRRYDVIILDVDLPHGNSLRVMNHIRHHLGLDTTVLFISGLRSRFTKLEALGGETVSNLDEPFTPTALLDDIARLLKEAPHRPRLR